MCSSCPLKWGASVATVGTLSFSFDIIAGAKTLNLSAKFAKVENKSNPAQDHKTKYTLIPESFIATAAGGFSEELAAQIKKAPLTAVETFTAMPTASHSLEVTMDLQGLVVDGKNVPAQKLVLTQVSAAEDWNKEEPNVTAFGELRGTAQDCDEEWPVLHLHILRKTLNFGASSSWEIVG